VWRIYSKYVLLDSGGMPQLFRLPQNHLNNVTVTEPKPRSAECQRERTVLRSDLLTAVQRSVRRLAQRDFLRSQRPRSISHRLPMKVEWIGAHVLKRRTTHSLVRCWGNLSGGKPQHISHHRKQSQCGGISFSEEFAHNNRDGKALSQVFLISPCERNQPTHSF